MHTKTQHHIGRDARHLKQARQHWEQGLGHAKRQEWRQAVAAFEKAMAGNPDDNLYRINLARALFKQGEPGKAVEHMQRAVQREPDNVLAREFLSECLCAQGRYAEASDAMLQGMGGAHTPSASYLQSLGNILFSAQRYKESIQVLMEALAMDITHVMSHYRMGLSFNALGMKNEAVECLTTALALDIGNGALACHTLMAFIRRELCQWELADRSLRDMGAVLEGFAPDTVAWSSVFACTTLTDDMDKQLRAARACANYYASGVKALPGLPVKPLPQRLRLGFVSADFHQHATTILMAELLEKLDRSRFDIRLYSHGPDDGSAMRQRIRQAADDFVEVGKMSDQQVAERIRSDGVDVLVDLKGHTVNCRMGIFAYRAAPVQVTYLGFPGTTGADYIDYFIGDAVASPLSHAHWYTEKIAHMPVCYQPNDRKRALPSATTRAEHGLPDDALVLCGFNQPFKISAEVMDVWCDFLHRLPHAVLWLLQWNDEIPQTLREEARKRGIDPARLVFAPRLPSDQHISRFALADLYLDTWPCNGHTTVSDALWAGVPVVTFEGQSFASRVAASLLHAVSLPQLCAGSLAGYQAQVLALAGDAQARQRIRTQLEASRDVAPLFDSEAYARDFSALIWRMAERHAQGLPADHLLAKQEAEGVAERNCA